MTELKNLKNKVEELNLSLLRLKTDKTKTIEEIVKKTNNFDKEYLIKYSNELLEKYINYQPNLFNQIIVSCFKLVTINCKYCSWNYNRIFLSDLLKLWNRGFVYKSNPIVNIENGIENGNCIITYIKNREIKHIKSDIKTYKKLNDLFFEILGKNYKTGKAYSKTSLSDLTFKF